MSLERCCVRRSLLECASAFQKRPSRTCRPFPAPHAWFYDLALPLRVSWFSTLTQHSPRSLQHISRHARPTSGASPAMDKQRSGEPCLLPAKRVRWDDSVLPDLTNTSRTASSNKAPPAPPSCSANDAIRLCRGKNRIYQAL